MIKPSFSATVNKKGELIFSDETALRAHLWKMKEGEQLKVTITRRVKARSLDQNAWYWGAVLPVISHDTGHTSDELHEVFKRMFLPAQEIEYRGKKLRIAGSTAKLSTVEFNNYIERIRAEAAQMGIAIPDPGMVDITP